MAEVTETNPKGAGAPSGNQNSIKSNRLWAETIKRALVQSDGERLRRIAEALLTKAEDGDMTAIREVGDRLDGKASQSVQLSGDDENPLAISVIERVIVKATDTNA
jgi:ribosomal protein L17